MADANDVTSLQSQEDRLMEQQVRLWEKSYERATNYANTVIAVGYGGLFAVWSLSKDLLPPAAAALAAVLATVSAGTFVMWEVYSSLSAAARYTAMARNLSLEAAAALRSIAVFEAGETKRHLSVARVQRLAVTVTVLTGLGAAAIIVAYNLRALCEILLTS